MTGRSHSSSVSKQNGLNSNPPLEVARSVKSAKSFKPVARPQASNTGARLRPNAPQARDARVDRDSIGDFAEFIRSTGKFDHHARYRHKGKLLTALRSCQLLRDRTH